MNIRRVLLVAIFGFGLGPACARAQYEYPFQNPNLPLEEWVNNIVSQMTAQEKVGFLSSSPGGRNSAVLVPGAIFIPRFAAE